VRYDEDALVLALTAKVGAGVYRTLPEEPARDADGLRMEMVRAAPG
jgi:predicted RNase H-like nuclease